MDNYCHESEHGHMLVVTARFINGQQKMDGLLMEKDTEDSEADENPTQRRI